MNLRGRNLLLTIVVTGAIAVGAWAVVRFKETNRRKADYVSNPSTIRTADPDLWARAMEKMKEERPAAEATAIEIPPQLRHYSDRHWFLAAQVAEVRKFNVHSCQDFVDLASMIERGELVVLPAVTENYILFGVGARANDGEFSRYQDEQNIELYNESELRDAYGRLESTRSKIQAEISRLQSQLATLKKADGKKREELQKELATRQQELKANDDDKALLDRSYGQPDQRQKLLSDYASLQTLAKNFAGRSFNLDDSSDRQAMKVSMLSSLRPAAVKVLEEIAKVYYDRFNRPLPISSLVRPEQYQHALNRVNRNAVLIDTPPHTTGLAFDIDYRYMSGAEQTFLMAQLARMKDQGRIEVIRERNANYHVFAFIDGQRPSDDLITASLDEATLPVKEANHTKTKPAEATTKSRTAKKTKANSKTKNSGSKSKAKRPGRRGG